ncbi:MAG: hypothetical protein ACOCU8_02245 [Patescibacteria group bacterium]
MSNEVIFESEEEEKLVRPPKSTTGLAGWLVKISGGLIDGEHKANVLMFVFSFLAFGLAVVIAVFFW